MTVPALVLDSGVLDRLTTDQEFRWVIRDLLERGWEALVPSVTLAETVTGRPTDAPLNQALKRVGTVDTTEPTARHAGRLRHAVERSETRRVPSGIDAIVAAHAAEAGRGVVFTSDPADLRRLLADHPRLSVERP